MATTIEELTRETFPTLVKDSERPVIIDFWGPACRPCLALAPTFDELAEAHPEVKFLKVLAPSNRMLCVDLKVMGLPTFLCMSKGKEIGRLTGEVSAPGLKEWVHDQSARAKGDE